MDKFMIVAGAAVLFIFTAAIFSVLGAIPVYFLWNWLCPALFGLPVVTFWQAWGLAWLTAVLFKSSFTSSTPNK